MTLLYPIRARATPTGDISGQLIEQCWTTTPVPPRMQQTEWFAWQHEATVLRREPSRWRTSCPCRGAQ
jgi:hypothetical protein